MTPKEKSLSLCQQFGSTTKFAEDCNEGKTLPLRVSKICALITVYEILNELVPSDFKDIGTFAGQKEYWQQVKSEIEMM